MTWIPLKIKFMSGKFSIQETLWRLKKNEQGIVLKCNLKSKRSWSNLWSSFHFFRKAMNSENKADREKWERQFFLHCPAQRCNNRFLQTFSSIKRSRGVSPCFCRPNLILRLLRPRTSLSSAVFALDSDSVRSSTGPKARCGRAAAAPSISAIPLESHHLWRKRNLLDPVSEQGISNRHFTHQIFRWWHCFWKRSDW